MRGQISFNTIIVLVIALMVLLLVGTFFSGGFGDLSSKLMIFGRESTGDSTQTGQMVACNSACTGWIAGGCPEPPRIHPQKLHQIHNNHSNYRNHILHTRRWMNSYQNDQPHSLKALYPQHAMDVMDKLFQCPHHRMRSPT